jgi:ADP-heptose:LPS heptosyltransferase
VKENKDWNGKRIVISRTDSIGDVLLTLPVVSWFKEQFPHCHITFLCKAYTAPIVRCHQKVDEVLILDELEKLNLQEQIAFIKQKKYDAIIHVFPRKELAKLFKQAAVPFRVGTSHRVYHWLNCNIRPNFTRKKSPLHEAQLNFELVRPFGLTEIPSIENINAKTKDLKIKPQVLPVIVPQDKKNGIVILHPKSQGSAREWPMEKYIHLAKELTVKNYVVCFTGTEKEGLLFRDKIPADENIIDTTGLLSIDQLMFLIKESKALVACSTGPLHIAGYAGIRAIGLFSPKVPIHPGRWKPLGEQSTTLVFDSECKTCAADKPCNCIEKISVQAVLDQL